MSQAGCQIPRALANWDGYQLTMADGHPMKVKKLMCKLPDSYLGIGDQIIENVILEGIRRNDEVARAKLKDRIKRRARRSDL